MHIIILVAALLLSSCQDQPRLILNAPSLHQLQLRNFRTSNGPFIRPDFNATSRQGLEHVPASGSAQFSGVGWVQLVTALSGKKFMVVDLRQESHGFLNHAIPVSWYAKRDWGNVGKTLTEITADETQRLQKLREAKSATIGNKNPALPNIALPVKTVATESEFVTGHGFDYLRLPITDHRRPSAAMVDQFLEIWKKLPNNSWLHFHCAGGDGRTTTFLAMADMLTNAKMVSFEDILRRQYLLGGENFAFFDTRLQFLKQFYIYAQGDRQEPWAAWSKNKS